MEGGRKGAWRAEEGGDGAALSLSSVMVRDNSRDRCQEWGAAAESGVEEAFCRLNSLCGVRAWPCSVVIVVWLLGVENMVGGHEDPVSIYYVLAYSFNLCP